MYTLIIAGLLLLAGCGDGGGTPAATTQAIPPSPRIPPPPPPVIQPDMLTATPQGLLRGKASGQGQGLIFARPNLHREDLFLSGDLVYYPRESPSIILDYPNQDIWSVRTDGTADHAILNTTADEFVRDAQGTIAIYEQNTYTLASGLERTEYGSLRNGSPLTTLPITERFTQYRFMLGTKAFFNNEQQIFSTNVDGSGLSTHATVRFPVTLAASDAFNSTLIHREYHANNGRATLQASTLSGGLPTSLNDGQTYVSYAGHVGQRVVFHSCGIVQDPEDGTFRSTECDVHSVNIDGSGIAVLTSHPANEAVQAIVGDQVIIRRNLSGNDQLIAVPVTGGTEQLLMTMTDSEFVQLVIGDRLLVSRPSGSWMLDLQGALTQISTVTGFGFIEIGNSVCANSGLAVWCMPIDGSTPAVKIADTGRVIGEI